MDLQQTVLFLLLVFCGVANALDLSMDQLDELENIIARLKDINLKKSKKAIEEQKNKDKDENDSQKDKRSIDLDDKLDISQYIDQKGRQCAENCRFQHKVCYGREGFQTNPTHLQATCMKEFMKCYPSCFFPITSGAGEYRRI